MSTVRVITPHALPMFREDKPRSTRRAMEKARKDPLLSKQPDLPIGSKGKLDVSQSLFSFPAFNVKYLINFRFGWTSGSLR